MEQQEPSYRDGECSSPAQGSFTTRERVVRASLDSLIGTLTRMLEIANITGVEIETTEDFYGYKVLLGAVSITGSVLSRSGPSGSTYDVIWCATDGLPSNNTTRVALDAVCSLLRKRILEAFSV